MFQTAALFKHLLLGVNILFQGSMYNDSLVGMCKCQLSTPRQHHYQVTTLWTLWTPMILNIWHIPRIYQNTYLGVI